MRVFCATAALCLAVAFIPSAGALASARHRHAASHAKPAESLETSTARKPSLFIHPESAGGRFRME